MFCDGKISLLRSAVFGVKYLISGKSGVERSVQCEAFLFPVLPSLNGSANPSADGGTFPPLGYCVLPRPRPADGENVQEAVAGVPG